MSEFQPRAARPIQGLSGVGDIAGVGLMSGVGDIAGVGLVAGIAGVGVIAGVAGVAGGSPMLLTWF